MVLKLCLKVKVTFLMSLNQQQPIPESPISISLTLTDNVSQDCYSKKAILNLSDYTLNGMGLLGLWLSLFITFDYCRFFLSFVLFRNLTKQSRFKYYVGSGTRGIFSCILNILPKKVLLLI